MKYIIKESKLDILMTEYLDEIVSSKKMSAFGEDVFLIYTDLGELYTYEEEVIIDYEYHNAKLGLRMDLVNAFMSMFSRNMEQTKEFFKNWFETKFNLNVKYVSTFELPQF